MPTNKSDIVGIMDLPIGTRNKKWWCGDGAGDADDIKAAFKAITGVKKSGQDKEKVVFFRYE